MRSLTIERVAALAPFTVWVPARLPPRWEIEAAFAAASERHGLAPSVYLHCAAANASHRVTLQQSPTRHPGEQPDYEHAHPGPWRVEPRAGRRIEVREPVEHWQPTQVRLELEGTRILIHSHDLDAKWLTELAATLVPAPTSPPDLMPPAANP